MLVKCYTTKNENGRGEMVKKGAKAIMEVRTALCSDIWEEIIDMPPEKKMHPEYGFCMNIVDLRS